MLWALLKHPAKQCSGFTAHCLLLAVLIREFKLATRYALLKRKRLGRLEGEAPEQHSVQNDPKRPHIYFGICLTIPFGDHFRRGIAQSAHMGYLTLKGVENPCDPKINDLDDLLYLRLVLCAIRKYYILEL